MSVLFRVSMLSLSCVATASCSASYPEAPSPTPVALFIYQPAGGQVPIGSTRGFHAWALDTDGVYENVTFEAAWSSSDSSIVRPLAAIPGLLGTLATFVTFSAVAQGAAQVTARYEGLEASATVAVSDPQRQVYPRLLLTNGVPSRVGSVLQATATLQRVLNGSRENVTSRAAWTSANPDVATVSEGGVVRAVGIGTTLITATFDDATEWYWLSIPPGP